MTAPAVATPHLVCILDDEAAVRAALGSMLRARGHRVALFATPAEFRDHDLPDLPSCLLLDIRLRNASGMDFQLELREAGRPIPVVLMTGHGSIPMSVKGMKAGAVDFLTKPFTEAEVLLAVDTALSTDRARRAQENAQATQRRALATLSSREREVMGLVAAGLMNKQVAAHLALSEITVKIHRGNAMRKMGAKSLADLVRMAERLDVRAPHVGRFRTAD